MFCSFSDTVSFAACIVVPIVSLICENLSETTSFKFPKNSLMTSIFSPIAATKFANASLIESHIAVTALRKSSFVFQSVTSATTRPAIIAITAMIGLADIAANKPVIAVFTLSIISPILKATASEPSVVTTPKIIGDNVMRISIKLCILPITFITLVAKSPRPSINSVTPSIPSSKNVVKSIFCTQSKTFCKAFPTFSENASQSTDSIQSDNCCKKLMTVGASFEPTFVRIFSNSACTELHEPDIVVPASRAVVPVIPKLS